MTSAQRVGGPGDEVALSARSAAQPGPVARRGRSPNASNRQNPFDFEEPADLQAWSNLALPDAKDKEPPIKLERVAETTHSARLRSRCSANSK